MEVNNAETFSQNYMNKSVMNANNLQPYVFPMNVFQEQYIFNANGNRIAHRRKFTEKEDKVIKNAVKYFGTSNWNIIAYFIPGRNARQCRDRYTNYLAPELVQLDWTDEEDKLLHEKFNEFGPKWTKIRQFFPTRSANNIKNRYNYTVCHKCFNPIHEESNESDDTDDQLMFEFDDKNKFNVFNDDFIGADDFFNDGCIY